jgi:hypothetical protein
LEGVKKKAGSRQQAAGSKIPGKIIGYWKTFPGVNIRNFLGYLLGRRERPP